jgi:hypothetical protein
VIYRFMIGIVYTRRCCDRVARVTHSQCLVPSAFGPERRLLRRRYRSAVLVVEDVREAETCIGLRIVGIVFQCLFEVRSRGELKSKGLRVEIRFSIPKFIQADFVPNPALILFGLIAPRAIKVVADPHGGNR